MKKFWFRTRFVWAVSTALFEEEADCVVDDVHVVLEYLFGNRIRYYFVKLPFDKLDWCVKAVEKAAIKSQYSTIVVDDISLHYEDIHRFYGYKQTTGEAVKKLD